MALCLGKHGMRQRSALEYWSGRLLTAAVLACLALIGAAFFFDILTAALARASNYREPMTSADAWAMEALCKLFAGAVFLSYLSKGQRRRLCDGR